MHDEFGPSLDYIGPFRKYDKVWGWGNNNRGVKFVIWKISISWSVVNILERRHRLGMKANTVYKIWKKKKEH